MNRGFSLIELLVAVSILGIVTAAGVTSYNDFNQRQTLKGAALTLKNDLRTAQAKTLAQEKLPGCGSNPLSGHKLAFIDNRNYKIVAVCGGDVDVATGLTLGQNVTKISGPSTILFKVLTQGVEGEGTICLSGFGRTYKISVTSSGEIKDEGFSNCP